MRVALSVFSYASIAAGEESRILDGLYPSRLFEVFVLCRNCLSNGVHEMLWFTYLIVVNDVQNALPKLCWRLGTILHAVVQMNFCTFAYMYNYMCMCTVTHVSVTEVHVYVLLKAYTCLTTPQTMTFLRPSYFHKKPSSYP